MALPTRRSLVSRLRRWDDQESWRDFFDTYWKLIYSAAIKAGLSDDEAEEVVQETVLSVAKKMPEFVYDPAVCSFKGWLLRVTRFRVLDQLRKRRPEFARGPASGRDGTDTDPIAQIPDPASLNLDEAWDVEWQKNLMDAALTRVKRKVKPQHFQVFHWFAVKELPAREVAKLAGVSVAHVFVIKQRVAALVRQEVRALEKGIR